jgi:transcriptional regulator with XRE-family HTH domain
MTSDPGDVGPLARWMAEKRVPPKELAELLGVTAGNVRLWRAGRHQPSSEMKVKLAVVTLDIERKLGIAEPRGVPVLDWFAGMEDASQAAS